MVDKQRDAYRDAYRDIYRDFYRDKNNMSKTVNNFGKNNSRTRNLK